jgi:tryptophan 2,3-dioxygenase
MTLEESVKEMIRELTRAKRYIDESIYPKTYRELPKVVKSLELLLKRIKHDEKE